MDKERFDQLDDLYITREDEVKDYSYLDDLDFEELFRRATSEKYSDKALIEYALQWFGESDVAEALLNDIGDKIENSLKEDIKNSDLWKPLRLQNTLIIRSLYRTINSPSKISHIVPSKNTFHIDSPYKEKLWKITLKRNLKTEKNG